MAVSVVPFRVDDFLGMVFVVFGVASCFLAVWMIIQIALDRKGRSSIDYTPRGDRVIVKRLPPPVAKEGEVIIPGSQRPPLNEGTVVAVGSAKELADIQIGDHVCFLDFAGTTIEVDGQE